MNNTYSKISLCRLHTAVLYANKISKVFMWVLETVQFYLQCFFFFGLQIAVCYATT